MANANNLRSRAVIRTYLILILFNTLAASMIWGVNTLFLLNAGLNITEAFAANAFFTAGMVLFEIPTGVIADTKGRRLSYLLGALTLSMSTIAYLAMWWVHFPFIGWAITSLGLGLGFTFFSGATDAWLVDALKFNGYEGQLDNVFGKAQVVGGIAMLGGSVIGGVVAQFTNLGAPYILRAGLLLVTFGIAAVYMRDIGFAPKKQNNYFKETGNILKNSVRYGFRNPAVRWVMFASPFLAGVGIYVFYALQPYLLSLYGDSKAYWIAGLAAAIVAGAQIIGGFMVSSVRKIFKRRTTILMVGAGFGAFVLMLIAVLPSFYAVIILVVIWSLVSAAVNPVRQSYLNSLIPTDQRATVLSFDSLLGSSGGVVSQPVLGKTADMFGYGASYFLSGVIQLLALPFLVLADRASKNHNKHL